MSQPHVRPSVLRDCEDLAGVMRAEDVLEVFCATGRLPQEELERLVRRPDSACTYSIVLGGGSVLGMFGVVRVPSSSRDVVGAPWLLGSPDLFDNHWRPFVRRGPAWIRTIASGFTLLESYAFQDNQTHVRWLRRVGFQLLEVVPYGIFELPFWRFRMRVDSTHDLRSRTPTGSKVISEI